ncbi:hypothetical protein [Plantactinospora sp. BC1]|uniref:hypothetical protein n=1 Tax=Plantactinospora sp. BC1 TaxID=2108470 RepID=UPI00131F0118|nr:hypothetical protein [Plantactinospora sp. BC1]
MISQGMGGDYRIRITGDFGLTYLEGNRRLDLKAEFRDHVLYWETDLAWKIGGGRELVTKEEARRILDRIWLYLNVERNMKVDIVDESGVSLRGEQGWRASELKQEDWERLHRYWEKREGRGTPFRRLWRLFVGR